MITKAFGGPAVMSADEAQAMMEAQFVSAGELMKAASALRDKAPSSCAGP